MPKLTDTQSILLSAAAQRDGHSIYPPPETVVSGARSTKAIASLIGMGFAEERETTTGAEIVRTDGDLAFGAYATAAGFAAIGVEVEAPEPAPSVVRVSKASVVIGLLQREAGATMPELAAATDWLPHTTRAALTGLRKKGHAIERFKRDEATCYRIAVRA